MPASDINFQNNLPNRKKITWLVCLLAKNETKRDETIILLKENGIEARPFFYLLSEMDIYKKYCKKLSLNASEISKRGLNMPTYENLKSLDEIEAIISKIF